MATKQPNNQLLKYAGMATQFFVAIGLGLYVGKKLDKLFSFTKPILIWVVPLLLIIVSIYKVAKETAPKKNNN